MRRYSSTKYGQLKQSRSAEHLYGDSLLVNTPSLKQSKSNHIHVQPRFLFMLTPIEGTIITIVSGVNGTREDTKRIIVYPQNVQQVFNLGQQTIHN